VDNSAAVDADFRRFVVTADDTPMEVSMTAFRVTPTELMGLSQQVHGTAGSIESELAGLRSRVLPISGTWTGQAQDRFQALYDEWNRSAQGLQQALAGISQLLSQAGQSYDEAERRIAGSFAGR
jgi:early secretory antigenic target protein ESAT-6